MFQSAELRNLSIRTRESSMDEFNNKVHYYRKEAKDGHYHNPYDVENELNEILIKNNNSSWELEDLAHEIGELFWSM